MLACWNLIRADWVSTPKYPVAYPDCRYPCCIRYVCSAVTSDPVDSSVRSLVYVVDVVIVVGEDTVGVVCTVAGLGGVAPSLLMKARVRGPKYPVAGVIPTDVWNLARASLVREPNIDVSLPGEPAPVLATVCPLAFRKRCRAYTSVPCAVSVRSRVNMTALAEAGGSTDDTAVGSIVVGRGMILFPPPPPPPPPPLLEDDELHADVVNDVV